jgi:hypothetical protein
VSVMQAWEEIYASQYMRLVTLMTRSVRLGG